MISIIIPSHNYGNALVNCVKSILKNKKNLIKEIIIVDDDSSDNTPKIIKKLKKIKKIRSFNCKFRNLAKTMNYAVKKARGNYICKIDPDDEIKKNFIHYLFEFLKINNFDFVFPDFEVIETNTKKKYIKSQFKNIFFSLFFYPHGSGCIYKKKLWKLVGGYNERNFYQDDFDFWLKIKKIKKIKIGHLEKPLYIYKKHKKNMSKNIIKKNFTKIKILLNSFF